MGALLPGIFFILGLSVGSFLNVAVLRFGFSERASARSRCAACGTTLTPLDLVPVLSYVFLRGRCRKCGSGLSIQYPLLELGTAFLFWLTAFVMPPAPTVAGIAGFLLLLGFWAALMALVMYDIRHTLIPLPFVYGLWVFALFRALVSAYSALSLTPLLDAALGAVVCGGFFALIHFVTRGRGMGIGDAYVAGAIGCMFGTATGVAACTLGVWVGALVGLIILLMQRLFPRGTLFVGRMRVTLSTEIPFAPFLAIGAVIAFAIPFTPFILGISDISPF